MLHVLPPEVLGMIFAEITDTRDFQSLCRVSKQLFEATKPLLYQTVRFRALDYALHDFHRGPAIGKGYLCYTKYFDMSAPFHDELAGRCLHNKVDFDEEWEEDVPTNEIDKLGERILPILEELTEDQLRGFSWNLGICVPRILLGPGGYLTERQMRIEKLSLITDGQCGYNMDGQSVLDLSKFKSICILSWIGLRSVEDFESLRDCLEGNAPRLESLTLDTLDWKEADDSWFTDYGQWNGERSPNFLARDILKLEEGTVEVKFPLLNILSLSSISFQRAISDFSNALNFENLHKLKLWNCPHSLELLTHISRSNMELKLTSFEFVLADEFWDYEDFGDAMELKMFLQAFTGLEDLYILFYGPAYWQDIGEGALNHKGTLQRFALHSRMVDVDENSDIFEEPCDCGIDWPRQMDDLLFAPRLECVGLCIEIPVLFERLSELTDRPPCKILHIRASGSSDLINRSQTSIYHSLNDLETGSSRDETEHIEMDNSSGQGSADNASERSDVPMTENERDNTGALNSSRNLEQMQLDEELSPLAEGDTEIFQRTSEPPPSFFEFAQWAFGPDGLPHLQLLVFGDFSHQDRYAKYNTLLCRNTDEMGVSLGLKLSDPTFRQFNESDASLSELFKVHSDFLGACAVTNVLKA